MKRIIIVASFLILLFVALPVSSALADPGFDRVIGEGETVEEDIVIFGGTLLVEHGAIVDGSVSVFGGEAELAGTIEGDVAIFGGEVLVSGLVDGDMVVFGGNLKADASAEVDGDCVLIGGIISGDGKDSIGCTAVGDLPNFALPALIGAQRDREITIPPLPPVREVSGGPGFFGTAGSVVARTFFLGLAALIVAALAPNHLNQISDTLRRKPGSTTAIGFLTFIAAVSLITIIAVISALLIIVCVGLLGIPLVIVMSLALTAAIFMGWIAAGSILGQRMAGWLKLSAHSFTFITVLGTVALTLVAGILSSLPFWLGGWIWWLMFVAVGCAGLGAAAVTRFGSRPYPPQADAAGMKVGAVMETLPDEEEEIDPAEKPPVK